MAELQARHTSPRTPVLHMYRALVGVGTLCGLLIVTVFVLTLPIIEQNQAEFLQSAVFRVLPGAVSKQSFFLGGDGAFRPAQAGDPPPQTVHAGFDGDGKLVGIAIQGQGMGYADTIRVLYGYAPQSQAIVGMQVLASKETPGLGDKIEKDPDFLQNFVALDVSLGSDGQTINNPIVPVKSGEKTEAWQIDSITGATISSKAIAKILRQGSKAWAPLIRAQRQMLEQAGGSGDES
jgi:electron transport complex protein RnfG